MKTYGTPANPFPELPPAASFYSVGWGGGAILISRPGAYVPLMLSTQCPALLTSQGSWVSWYYGVPSGQFDYGDETYGVPATGFSFDFHIRSGFIDPHWAYPGVEGSGDALFSRVVSVSADNSQHWTIRPVDSWAIVFQSDMEGDDFYVMADVGLLPFEKWHCVMMSWIVGGASSIVYDDIVQIVGFEPEGFGGIWDGSYQDQGGAVAPVPERLALMSGEGGHYDWWLSTEFIDFAAVENRRRFIDADLKPVPLGPDGALGSPTRRAPEFFFHPGKTLEAFTKNRGTGGAVRWTDQAGVNEGYFVDPVWQQMKKPTAAATSGTP